MRNLFIGMSATGTPPFIGKIDNLRVTDGVKRYNGVGFVPDFETPYSLE